MFKLNFIMTVKTFVLIFFDIITYTWTQNYWFNWNNIVNWFVCTSSVISTF